MRGIDLCENHRGRVGEDAGRNRAFRRFACTYTRPFGYLSMLTVRVYSGPGVQLANI